VGVPETYIVAPVSATLGKLFVREHHYSGGIHNGPMCYGLYERVGMRLVGVCAFATPASERVCASIFGLEFKRSVTELHRLVLLDEIPKNSESFFISGALRLLRQDRPKYAAVVSFADPMEGHRGTIYQATNAMYSGTTERRRFWRDETGRLRHPRQSGRNIGPVEAASRGWVPEYREGKHRYLWVLPMSKSERKTWMRRLLLEALPYPAPIELERAA
jgi:hypothetical protein